ncbi:MAG: phospholipase D-like domain-containing protein [Chthoniobacter sp.]|uniref:phospholipase D-like domain-containing protein n=1 Tax=Chthoniobacter sp. TaxID=2510640 RepID=UPI0032ABA5D7
MSKKPSYKLTRWKIVGIVVLSLLIVLVAVAAFGIGFLKRAVVDYRWQHDFSTRDPSFFGSAHAMADPLPLEGNSVQLLHNGDQIFPAMLEAIHSAKASVNFEAFLFYSDGVGAQFRDALCERARAGVRVRVLLDGIGSGSKFSDVDEKTLRNAGCSFSYYHPTHSWRVDKLNRRTHRRILIVDGKVGFTGSVGFADPWSGHAESPEHWRDIHVRLEGPIVAKLQGAFQQHWVRGTGETISGMSEFPPLPPAGKLRTQLIASHSFSISPISLVQAVAFASAEKTIFITNAYCTPSHNQVKLLTEAAKRGVDVRILVPGPHNDQPMTKAAGRSAYGELLTGGVKIYEYAPTMIHTKTMVVDGLFTVIGSSNFDSRSAQINEELDITIYDEGFGGEMDAVFRQDLERANPYRLEDFQKRPFRERVTEWAVAPLSPLL